MIISEQQAQELRANIEKWKPMVERAYEELGWGAYGEVAKGQDKERAKLLDTIIALYQRIRELEQHGPRHD